MSVRDDILEHLRFLGEIGVSGSSRDPSWRRRSETAAEAAAHAPEASSEAGQFASVPHPAESSDETGLDAPWHDDQPGDQSGDQPADQVPDVEREAVSPTDVGESAGAAPGPDRLGDVRRDLGDCTRCKLHGLGRRQIVFGVGNPKADLMFVGEAPGQDEDRQGIPFVGRSGQLLTKIIESIDLTRDEVYIANVIKCRPPQNRNPEPDEVEECEPFLFGQVDAIQPKVVVALGKFAAQALLRSSDPISRLRGRVYEYRGAQLIPTFHPAYLLRNPSSKRDVWEDMKKVRALLGGA